MVAAIQKKCVLWMDGSLFFRGILGFFNLITHFFSGSLLVRLFTEDFDQERLQYSHFVRIAEDIFNRFPKILRPPAGPVIPPTPLWLQGSVIARFLTESMETPIIREYEVNTVSDTPDLNFGKIPKSSKIESLKSQGLIPWFRWIGAAFPSWGLLAVVISAPFLPTMIVAGMLVLVFASTLFRYDFKLDLTSVPLLLFIAVSLFSGFMSAAASYSIPIAVLTTIMMSSYLLTKACFLTRRRIDFVIAAFIIAAAVTALVGIFQIFTGYMHTAWVDRDLFAALSMRIYSTFANPNVYGTYLLLVIPLAAGCILYAKNLWYKLLASGVTVLLLTALGLTYSRGGYIALAGAVLFFLILVERRLIVLFVAGVAAMPFVLPASVLARLLSIVNFTDSSTIYRISIWQASLRMLGDFWMAGIGQGAEAYNSVYPFYAFSAVTALHSHNLFLQIFLETGIVGLVAFFGILACFFRTQFSFMRHTADFRRKILSAAMTAAVVGFLIQGTFDHSFHNYRVMLVFYLFLGIANCLTEMETET